MPVQDSMQSLTAVAASNSPAGTDAISNTLDDYLRSYAAILRHTEARGATLTTTASMSLAAATGAYVHFDGTDTITHLGTVDAGIERVVVFKGACTLTHNATSLILPGGVSIVTAAGDSAIFRSEGAGNWRCINYTRASTGYVTKGITRYTTGSGTYTVPTGVRALYVECYGGGGGAGGTHGGGVGTAAASAGGGGGAYCAKLITGTLEASYSYAVGAGGTAGGPGASAGSAGGDSTFAGGAIALSAGGGAGGAESSGAADVGATPGDGGTATGGDVNISGGVGPYSRVTAAVYQSISLGAEAAGPLGGKQRIWANGTGTAGKSYGGGGGPSVLSGGSSDYAGGAGAAGLVQITEYY